MNNKDIVKYFYETIVSLNQLNQISNYIAENCTVRIGETTIPLGITGMTEHLTEIKKTYPDYTMKITRQHCDGEYVISEFIMEGTHEGEWLDMKPTHKKLTFTGVDIDRLIDGKIVEHGGAVNTFDTLFAENIIKPA